MNFSQLIQIIRDLISAGKKLKKSSNIANQFPDYQNQLRSTVLALESKADDDLIVNRLKAIASMEPKKLTILNRLILFKFRADYLSNWNEVGKYLYFIDEVNLLLSGILKSLVVDEMEP
ncbi:hypothetical protein [Ekhidna sp.]|uniref:hypothetical protein n=1 Tax=Ekhidna sp. TaxID=2608089 RepID=UPI003B59B632